MKELRGSAMMERSHLIVFLLIGLMAGCAGGPSRQGGVVDRQIPAPQEPPAPPPVRNEAIDPALQAAARSEIGAALASNNELIRMHAVEAAQNGLGASDPSIYLRGLKAPAATVRFASAMSIGHLKIAQAKDELLQMVNDPNIHVRIGVRYALHRLGDKRYSKDLEGTAKDPQWQVRSETARVLGLLGEPTAVRVLKPMLRDSEPSVRLQAADSLWRLGNEEGLRALVAASMSGYTDDQMLALLGLAGPKDRRVLGHLHAALTADYAEVRLVAARAMGMCGSDEGYAIAAEGVKSADPRQRVLAAVALGAIGRSDAQGYLATLLKDKDSPDVRLSAAQAILELKAPVASARGE
jgi:HEAT repeat protein